MVLNLLFALIFMRSLCLLGLLYLLKDRGRIKKFVPIKFPVTHLKRHLALNWENVKKKIVKKYTTGIHCMDALKEKGYCTYTCLVYLVFSFDFMLIAWLLKFHSVIR